ncbi:uncharacterized protein LOC126672949 [Mercurialis annua]|uniref:uncharacterized protein LOC126672949 n=1 Tax=Mercurialis annua TaxID=3986 RepID=UPI00215EF5F1|nr:uncharacterized protein LOC126672949 [Mercurialis annua]
MARGRGGVGKLSPSPSPLTRYHKTEEEGLCLLKCSNLQSEFYLLHSTRRSSTTFRSLEFVKTVVARKKTNDICVWTRLLGLSLPTCDNLETRRVFVNASCSVCGGLDESISHLLAACPFAQDCWLKAGFAPPLVVSQRFKDWAVVVGEKGGGLSCKWSLTVEVANLACAQLLAWQAARLKLQEVLIQLLSKDDGVVNWSKPAMGMWKVKVDVGRKPDGSSIGLGCLVRDSGGVLVQARAVNILSNYDPRVAEIMGIQEALSWLKGVQSEVVESDALEVILDICNPTRAELYPLIMDCVELAKQISNLSFVYVRRFANRAAHVDARYARSMSGYQE